MTVWFNSLTLDIAAYSSLDIETTICYERLFCIISIESILISFVHKYRKDSHDTSCTLRIDNARNGTKLGIFSHLKFIKPYQHSKTKAWSHCMLE